MAAGVSKRFGRRTVLKDTSLEAYPGEAVAIVGENGAGKSTLLRICAGLLRPDAGRVWAGGRIGYCPQTPGIFELLGIDEHLVAFGGAFGLSRKDSIDRGRRILHELGWSGRDDWIARNLSGGTLQKLNLTLALVGEPRILLLDEPYQGFDAGSYLNFWDRVDDWRKGGAAVIVVTHMLSELHRVDRVIDVATAEEAAA